MTKLDLERYIFEINVYTCSPEKFFGKRNEKLNQEIERAELSGGLMPEKQKQMFINYLQEQYGGWDYSQIVGIIKLYVLGSDIRGETWFVDAKRIARKMRKKNFVHYGKTFELLISDEMNSVEIYDLLRGELKAVAKDKPFRDRYIDLEAFANIGVFVNWRAITGLDK